MLTGCLFDYLRVFWISVHDYLHVFWLYVHGCLHAFYPSIHVWLSAYDFLHAFLLSIHAFLHASWLSRSWFLHAGSFAYLLAIWVITIICVQDINTNSYTVVSTRDALIKNMSYTTILYYSLHTYLLQCTHVDALKDIHTLCTLYSVYVCATCMAQHHIIVCCKLYVMCIVNFKSSTHKTTIPYKYL
jgi:hypothetical protein